MKISAVSNYGQSYQVLNQNKPYPCGYTSKDKTNFGHTVKVNNFRKWFMGVTAGLGLAAMLPAFTQCKKDIVQPENEVVTTAETNKDYVDFAFRDFVNLFGLDTNGYTKILKQAYVLNDGDYTIDTFETPKNADTMFSHGVYYNNHDQLGPFEYPYEAVWTRTKYNGKDAVKVDYEYPWLTKKPHMPEPKEVYYIPGASGDNAMKMYINPVTSPFWADVDVVGDTATYKVEDINVKNPFWVEIKENY